MSEAKWEQAWRAEVPDGLHNVQSPPVCVKSVYDAEGLIRYLCKSPWSSANTDTLEDAVETVGSISTILQATRGLRRYLSDGTLLLRDVPRY